jgi:uncharacterized membrane protein
MTELDYKHTWTISESSRLLRFYAWCWGADPRKADFCRLFWGLLFFPVALVGRLFAPVARLLARKVEAADAKPPPPKKDQTDRLDKIAVFFANPRTRTVVKVVGVAVLVILGLGVLALVVIAIVSNPLKFLLVVGGVLVGVLLIVAVAANSKRIERAFTVLAFSLREVKRNTCPRIEVRDEA